MDMKTVQCYYMKTDLLVESFKAMCDEVPKVKLSNKYYYDEIEVEKHLIKNKGFKRAIYEAELFID